MTPSSPRLANRPAIPAVHHGSVSAHELAQYGLSPEQVVDFSVNTNPLGPAPSVLAAIRDTNWSRYPGDDELPLREALAAQCGVAVEQVALGNGSVDLLWHVCLALLRSDDEVAVVGPTFGEYARAAQVACASVRTCADVGALADERLVFLCQPNNPTGSYRPRAVVEQVLAARPERMLLLDEAYASFVDERWRAEPLLSHGNLLLLRSLTKDHAVPGVRLGYLLASPDVVTAVEAVRPPWNVNAGALRAGLAALEPAAQAHLARARAMVRASHALLVGGLQALGLRVYPSQANFVLAEVGDGAAVRRALLPSGLAVRDCASFGLPACIRIACRQPGECARLLDALARVLRP